MRNIRMTPMNFWLVEKQSDNIVLLTEKAETGDLLQVFTDDETKGLVSEKTLICRVIQLLGTCNGGSMCNIEVIETITYDTKKDAWKNYLQQ